MANGNSRRDPDQDPFSFAEALRRRQEGGERPSRPSLRSPEPQEADPFGFGDVVGSREGRRARPRPSPAGPEPTPEPPEEEGPGVFDRVMEFFRREGEPETFREEGEPLLAGEEPTTFEALGEEADRRATTMRGVLEQTREEQTGPMIAPAMERELEQAVVEELERQGKREAPGPAELEETPAGSKMVEVITPEGFRERRIVSPAPGLADEDLQRRRRRAGGGARDIVPAMGRGLEESGMATAIGLTELVGAEDAEERLRATREELREFYGVPQTTGGRVAEGVSRLAGDLTQFVAPEVGLTRLGALPKTVGTLKRIGREIALGAPLDAMIAASDRENSLAGFAADMAQESEDVPTEWKAELQEVADTPWKRAVFDAATGSVLAGGAVAGLDAIGRGLRAVRSATQQTGEQVLREARIQSVTDNFQQASDTRAPLETRPVEAERLEELPEEDLVGLREELATELERARARGIAGAAVERDLRRVGRALGETPAPDAAARTRGEGAARRTDVGAGGEAGVGVEGPQRGAERLEETADEAERGLVERLRRRAIQTLGGEPAEELERVRREAQTDPLTGLPNRRGERSALERRPPAEGSTRLQLMADLDNFKAVNDRLSQEAGDRYLQDVARILEDVVREEDAVSIARIGGDEFRVTIDARAGTDPEALRVRLQEEVNAELAARGMDQVEDVPLGMTFFEPGAKTEAKRAAGRSMARSRLEAPRRPGPADLAPGEARQQAARAAAQGDVENVRRAEATLTEEGDRGRQPPVDAPVGPRGEQPSSDVFSLRVGDIDLDPDRFQYKLTGRQAAGKALEGVEDWDYTKAGVMSVWWDPRAERWFVVNGHNRMNLAQDVLEEDAPVNVLELKAESPQQARAMGAMQNIAEGRGSAVDAAKFFRDTEMDAEKVAELNIPMTESKVKKGLALARLHPAIFDDVVSQRVKVNRAVILGESGLPPEQQLAIHQAEELNDLNQGELEEFIRMARGSGSREVSQETLFGEEAFQESNLLERVKISRRVRRELAADKRIFGPLSRESRASRIEQKGAGTVERERASELATEAEQFEEVYEALSTGSGPVTRILNRHARAVGAGEETLTEASETATEEIKDALREFIEEGNLRAEVQRAEAEAAGPDGVQPADGRGAGPGAPGDREGVPGGGAGRGEPGEQPRDVEGTAPEPELEEPALPEQDYSPAGEEELASILREAHPEEADRLASSLKNTRTGRLIEQFDAEIQDAGGLTALARAQLQELASRGENVTSLMSDAEKAYNVRLMQPYSRNFIDEYDRLQGRASNIDQQRPTDLPETEGPEGTDDLELFERADEAYGGGEVAERISQYEGRRARTAHGSEAAARQVAEDVHQLSMEFSSGSVDGVPMPGRRMEAVQEGASRREWVDVRGQTLSGPDAAYRMLAPFRFPKAERMHFFFLDERGKVLGHTMEGSGAINTVAFTERNIHAAYSRAKRLGADEIVVAHNHPSGEIDPSKEDVGFIAWMRRKLLRFEQREQLASRQTRGPAEEEAKVAEAAARQKMAFGEDPGGVTIRRSYVIDHEKIAEIRWEPGPEGDFVVSQFEYEGRPNAPDWTDVRGQKISGKDGPRQVFELVGREDRPELLDVLYLDNQNRAVALEPHRTGAMETAETWIPQQARAMGARSAIIVAHAGASAPYRIALRAANRIQQNADIETDLLDVIAIEPTAPEGYLSARELRFVENRPGLAPREEPPPTPARQVFERGLPENEEVTRAAIQDPETGKVWEGRSHLQAIKRVPQDVPKERLVDGFVTSEGRFVDRAEAMGLEEDAIEQPVWEGHLAAEEVRRSPAQAARERTERAKDVFGTTNDPFEAGYITRDGDMIDFSGKAEGGPAGTRSLDHRAISQVFEEGFDQPLAAVTRFMAEGNMSLHVSEDLVKVRISTNPTADQVTALQDAVRAMRDRVGRGRNTLSIDVYDPRSNEYVTSVHVQEPKPGAVGGPLRQAVREAEEAGFDPSDVRSISRGEADVRAVTDQDVLAPKTYPEAPRAIATDQANHIRDVAEGLKEARPDALEEAAELMSQQVPPGSRFIPIPDHTGSTRANRALANEIARRTEGEVVDVLERAPNEESSFARRRQGEPGLTPDEIRHRVATDPGDLEDAYLVDNVVTTGATATSANRALGDQVPVLAWAKSSDVDHRRTLELRARNAGRSLQEARDPTVRERGETYGQEDMFGSTAPAEGGDQFDMGLRGQEPVMQDLSAAEQQARETVMELQDAVDQGRIAGEDMARYNEALKLLRRNRPVETDELIARARMQAFNEGRTPVRPEDEGQRDLFGDQAGAALPKVLRQIAGAGTGGTIGAMLDDENPWRGAAIGAVVGGGLVELPGAWTDVMARRTRGLRERVEQAAEAAVRGEPPGAPHYRGPSNMTEADVEEAVNFEKFELDPTGEDRLKEEVRRIGSESGVKAPHKKVGMEEARELARTLALDPEDVLPQVGERMTGVELTALGNIVMDNIEKTIRMLEALNHPSLTMEQEQVLRRNLQTREAQNNFLLEKILRGRSQKGRDLSHLRLTAVGARGDDGKLMAEPFYIQAKRFLGDDAFTTEHAARINEFIQNDDLEGLAQYISSLRNPTLTEKIVTLWKANLMSAPITQIRNLAGNTSMATLETVKDPVAFVGDRLISLAFDTGIHTKAAPRPGRLAKASWEGLKKGAREAEAVLRTGIRIDDAAIKYDLTRAEVNFNNVLVDTYTKAVFRGMIAGDRVFKGIAFMRALDEMAQVTAKMEGLEAGTDAYKQRVAELLKAPTDEMAAQAIHDAEIATFTNRNILGDIGVNIKRQVPLMEGVIPFTNTPANIALRTVDYTPFGFLRTAHGAFELAKVAAGGIEDAATRRQVLAIQRHMANNFGRNVVGSLGLAAVGYKLAEAGVMTGSWPSDRKTQREWQRRGIPSNGIYIPEGTPGVPKSMQGKWGTIENISPWGNIMAWGANLYDVVANPETTGAVDVVAGAGVSIAETVSEQSFLTGLSDALSALNNPDRASGDAFRRAVTSFMVPNFMKKISEGLDTKIRSGETFGEELGRRLPPALQRGPVDAPAQIGTFGEDIEREGGILKSLFDPFNTRTDRALEDEVIMELSRTGASVSELRQKEDETRAEFRQRKRIVGQRLRAGLERFINDSTYRAIPSIVEQAVQQNAALRGRLDPDEYARTLQRDLLEGVVRSIKTGQNRRIEVEEALGRLREGEAPVGQ